MEQQKVRHPNLFQKLVLIIGIAVGMSGFWLINKAFSLDPTVSWGFLMTVSLWLLLIFIMILTDSNESIKEELGMIIKEHIGETKLLKEEIVILQKITDKVTESNTGIKRELAQIIKEHIDETKLLKEEIVILQRITDKVTKTNTELKKDMKQVMHELLTETKLLKKEGKILKKVAKKK